MSMSLKMEVNNDPAIPLLLFRSLLRTHSRDLQKCSMAALFTIAKTMGTTAEHAILERTNQLYVHTMGYYTAVKMNS